MSMKDKVSKLEGRGRRRMKPRIVRVCRNDKEVAAALKEFKALPPDPTRLKPRIIRIVRADMSGGSRKRHKTGL